MLTRMLTLGNVMVVSSAARRGPYWHLLETCLHVDGTHYQDHIAAILESVSQRMGLESFSQLFEAYAFQIAYSIRTGGLDFLRFPPRLLGYQDRKACAEAAFRAFTPANILADESAPEQMSHGQKLFANHCSIIQKTTAQGIRECFGDICGFQIVDWIESNAPLDSLEKVLLFNAKDIGDSASFEECLRQNVDGIVVAILRALGDQELDLIIEALRHVCNGDAASTFQAISSRGTNDFQTHTPNLPTFPARTILQALDWFSERTPDVKSNATSYHVLYELFSNIHRSPLVNEQIRLLNAMRLWVAFRHDNFQNSTLLYTLIRGATSLLAQSDLAHAAQSILEWAFNCYRRIACKDPRFPDILVRICRIAYDYSRVDDLSVSKLGQDMLRWIDAQALAFCKVSALRGQVVRALPAWPQEPSQGLLQIYQDISSESLSGVLGDPRISSNRFRLVRRFAELATRGEYDNEQFAKTDFWRLRDCIPESHRLRDEDIDAFATLLVLSKGHIDGFGSDQHHSASLRIRHRLDAKKRTGASAGDNSTSQYSIVLFLLAMLDGNDMTQVHVAYCTLRSLMSVAGVDMPQVYVWTSEQRTELEFLQSYRKMPHARPLRAMSELLTSSIYMQSTRDFHRWIAMTTILLTDVLGSSDSFYVQLTPILEADSAFAEQILPVLVHIALAAVFKDIDHESSPRTLLSNYFSSILSSDFAHVACRRVIVDIVLHLRNIQPPYSNDPLAPDKWLNLDYTVLGRNAIMCGAYTTALLFLELAAEYKDPSVSEDPTAEQILFDIYSHIDEPDGFYGIKTKDLHQFLIKRFHHEKQWDKAFHFHGAALEAGTKDTTTSEGLLQSFHSFGFDHLAINTLQGSLIASGSAFNSTSMNYRLGWRTETWDLPVRADRSNPGSLLYLVLRAVHRERGPKAIDAVLRHSLAEEMGRLRTLGSESLAEIREVTQNLMCLCQVTHWRSSRIQDRLAGKQTDLQAWKDFNHLDGDFEYVSVSHLWDSG
jgi:ataxia telangiectasia mutated family protein